MRGAGLLPEPRFLGPFCLIAGTHRDPDLDADLGGVAAGLLGQPAQLAEDFERALIRGIGVRHPAIAEFGDPLQSALVMAAEPHRHFSGCRARVDAGILDRVPAPFESTCGSAHSFCMTCTCSSERRPRLWKFSLSPTNSTSFHPTPMPSRNRPPHSTSRQAACLATSTVWRCARISTWVEKSPIFVQPARNPNNTNGS